MHLIASLARIRFGAGARRSLPEELGLAGVRRPMVVTDRGVVAAGLIGQIENTGPGAVPVFDNCRENPTEAAARAGARFLRDHRRDGVIGVGGGSSIDLARGGGAAGDASGGRRHGTARRRCEGMARPEDGRADRGGRPLLRPAGHRASCAVRASRHGRACARSDGRPGRERGRPDTRERMRREQHRLRHQPDGRAAEQRARPVRAGRAERVRPARRAEADGRIGERAGAVALLDLRRMQPSTPHRGLFHRAARIGDAKLPGRMARDPARDSGRLVEKRAEPDGEPEQHVIRTPGAGQRAIGIVEADMPRGLLRARFAAIPAMAPLLFGGRERDRHPLSRNA